MVTTQGRDQGARRGVPRRSAPAEPTVRFARSAGVLYCSAGIVGLALTGTSDLMPNTGSLLLVFEVNALQNLLHLGLGLALVAASAATAETARVVTLLTAAATGVAGLFGIAVIGAESNVLALNTASNNAHLVTAAAATVAAVRATRGRAGG